MSQDRAQALDLETGRWLRQLDQLSGPAHPLSHLDGRRTLAIFESQVRSRHLDFAAQQLRERGVGFYTIGSAGHEGNAAVAAALRPTDPALLHYRSGAFFLHRAQQLAAPQAVRDIVLGMVASRDDPIAGGRHKVFGSSTLQIPPQTSTIASHLPKAVGLAFALERSKRLALGLDLPPDAIVLCSFGDASISHSTALGAIHSACRTAFEHLPLPLLFLCEDNGLGISVRTPRGFIEAFFSERPGLRYFRGDGCDVRSAFEAASQASSYVRESRSPALLHLRVVRLMGHAGSDVELTYRTPEEIRHDAEHDPIRKTAQILVEAGVATPDELHRRYEEIRGEVRAAADEAAVHPRLRDAEDVMAPIAVHSEEKVEEEARRGAEESLRRSFWGHRLPAEEQAVTLGAHLNFALGDLLVKYPELIVFGEDVARKGGVYGITRGLMQRAGAARVFDTLLDEQSILGLAIGAGQLGLLPMPEIQYLAYLHNAEDQIRGEAATLQFFSQGQYRNPMVVRIASYAYQKGFGGHFHNDNSVAVLRDVPGLVIASPARGEDAAAMLRSCVAAARVNGRVCVFLEPIALYGVRDLYEEGDGAFASPYRVDGEPVPLGSGRVYGEGGDLLLVSFANGVRMSLRVARRLEKDHGIRCRVLDLRWLAPLPLDDLLDQARKVQRILVVDETRRTGGVSEGVITALVEAGFRGGLSRIASHDSFIPLGEAANHVLIGEASIEAAALKLCQQG